MENLETQEKVAVQAFNEVSGKWEISFNGKVYHSFAQKAWGQRTFANSRKLQKLAVQRLEVMNDGKGEKSKKTEKVVAVQSKFSIKERFQFIDELTSMVREGVTPSMIVSGQGGLGKTWNVMENLSELKENEDYVVIKGFSTAKALFRTLQTNNVNPRTGNPMIIIFDDCDSVLKDPASQNLLKAALDSFSTRKITWNAESRDDLERDFDYKGKIIFISNLPYSRIPQSLVSRSYTIDLTMTTKDILERMEEILPELVPHELDMPEKEEALQFCKDNADSITDLNFRTLIKVAKIRKGAKIGDWRKMAEYMTMAQDALGAESE